MGCASTLSRSNSSPERAQSFVVTDHFHGVRIAKRDETNSKETYDKQSTAGNEATLSRLPKNYIVFRQVSYVPYEVNDKSSYFSNSGREKHF